MAILQPDRDRWGRPMIPDITTGELVPYLRPSSLPDQLNDDFAISRWKMRQLARGIGMRKDLWFLAATTPGDQLFKFDEVVSGAMAMVDGDTGARMGTAIHNVLEHDIFNPELDEVHEAAMSVKAALIACGLTRIDGTAETFLINDKIRSAGSTDGYVVDDNGIVYVFDIKTVEDITGKIANYKVRGWGVQTGTYANAEWSWDGEKRIPIGYTPSLEFSKIAFVSRTTGESMILDVDIRIGWIGAQMARAAYDYKKIKTEELIAARSKSFFAPPPEPEADHFGDITVAAATAALDDLTAIDPQSIATPVVAEPDPFDDPTPAVPVAPPDPEPTKPAKAKPKAKKKAATEPVDEIEPVINPDDLAAAAEAMANARAAALLQPAGDPMIVWLKGRLLKLIEAGYRSDVAQRWPKDLPTLKAGGQTIGDCDKIKEILNDVEKQHRQPFPDEEPGTEGPMASRTLPAISESAVIPDAPSVDADAAGPESPAPVAAPTTPSEGRALTAAEIAAVGTVLAALTPERGAWVKARVIEANACGYPLKVSANPTERRLAIASAIIECSAHGDDEAVVRALMAYALNNEQFATTEIALGACFAAMSIEGADRLHKASMSLGAPGPAQLYVLFGATGPFISQEPF